VKTRGLRIDRIAILLAIALALLATGAKGAEERGVLKGRVADTRNSPLPGATVHVEPGRIAVITNHEGSFTISNLAPGNYRVEISYLGFEPETRDVTVATAATASIEAKLRPSLNVSENVTVSASRIHGEAEALNQRKTDMNLVDVLPADVITSLPNANLADAIGRLPSVSLERDEGEGKYVQVRGLEPRFTNVTIDGVHIPSVSGTNEGFGRQIKLDAFPSALVGGVELYKTISADQDGDAIGGSVNIVTRVPGDSPSFHVEAEGGYVDLLGGRSLYNINGTYTNRFGPDKKLGLSLSGAYDWNGRGINDIEPSNDIVTLPNGSSAGAFTGIDIREYRYDRSRFGGAGSLDYRLAENSELFLRGFFSQFQNYGDRWVTSISAGNFLTPTVTDNTGSFSGSVQNRRPNEQTWSLGTGGRHLLGTIFVDYTISYAHARQNRVDQRQADYDGSSAAFQIDSSDGFFPKFTPLGGANQLDPTQYVVTSYRISDERSAAHDAALALNVRIPYGLADFPSELKIGGKYRDEKKTFRSHNRFFDATGDPAFNVSQGLDSFHDPNYYFGRYLQGPNLSLDAITRFFNENPGAFTEDVNTEHLENDANNFDAKEKVAALYVKNTTTIGRLEIAGGVRIERTDASYDGFQVNLDADGNWLSSQPVSGGRTYTNVLPSVSLKYSLDPSTNLRAVYGWAVGRPDYGLLAPSLFLSDVQKQINAGNPKLKPTKARSYDLLFEHFLGSIGVIAAGGFYKDLTDPIYPGSASIIHGGIYDGFTKIQPVNGPSAKIYGAEVAWQEHLHSLPGLLSGLGINANYTYTNSKATFDPSTGRTGTARLQRTTPNEFNLGLTYDMGPLAVRAAATYNAATIFVYQFTDGAPGGLRGPHGDTYLYPHTQIDAQASYALRNGLEVVVSGLNLNNEVFGFYNGSPHWNIQREFYGRTYSLGLRLNM